VVLLGPADVGGFGTVDNFGDQNNEHERITRAALACPAGAPSDGTCFEPATLDQLAGRGASVLSSPTTYGGVGAPDRPVGGELIPNVGEAHCDDADFLDTSSYPRTRAQATRALAACLEHLQARFGDATLAARMTVRGAHPGDPNPPPPGAPPMIRSEKVQITDGSGNPNCPFSKLGPSGRGKCDVLNSFGRALHGVQDFHSHSNWDDLPDPGKSIGVKNPPGLGHAGVAPFLILRHITPNLDVPRDLATGCANRPEKLRCRRRITHTTLNKDLGFVEPVTGISGAAGTSRGQIGNIDSDNFRRAVRGAIAETRRQWEDFRQQLVTAHGAERAALMVCAITRDDPVNTCQGRKLGIVIDSSGSNNQTDPRGLRIAAAQAFNASLTSQADMQGAAGTPDQSTVITFSDTARLLSPLDDPSRASFAGIGALGGTCIACGVAAAHNQLAASTTEPPPYPRFGIVVLTDGQDGDVNRIAQVITAAAAVGIRTSIGFLTPPTNPVTARSAQTPLRPAPAVIAAVQRSGGVLATINSARAQRVFVDVALANGLTSVNDLNGTDDGGVLALGVRVTARIAPRRDADTWSYRVPARRRVKLTVTARRTMRVRVTTARTGRTLARARASRRRSARIILARARQARTVEVRISARRPVAAANYRIGLSRAPQRRR